MVVNFLKTLMVLIICLTFVGQTMASTFMSYHMTGMKGHMPSQNMSMMDHSNHSMVSDSSVDIEKPAETPSEECCTKTCNCFTGGCSSFAVIMKNAAPHNAIIDLSSKILSYSSLALSQQPKSLYRPPIIS